MIRFRFNHDKAILLEYAERLGNTSVPEIVERGVIGSAAEAEDLAKFYWQMVDASLEDDIEAEHERILNTLRGACYQSGFEEVWEDEVSRA